MLEAPDLGLLFRKLRPMLRDFVPMPRDLVLVLRDRELAQIAQFQRTALSRETASALPDFDVAAIAHGVGVECLALRRDAEIGAVLGWARDVVAAGRPVVVDVAIDYSVPTWFTRGVVRTNLLRLPWRAPWPTRRARAGVTAAFGGRFKTTRPCRATLPW